MGEVNMQCHANASWHASVVLINDNTFVENMTVK